MFRRAALAALTLCLLVTAPALALPAFAATTSAQGTPAPTEAIATSPKVVIVVGAVETYTSGDRTDADTIYAEAIKYTPNVVKVYSPNATWAAVKAAAQGASIFIYLGHGYGFPSPYKTVLTPSVHDGMGLNEFAGQGDSDKKYYGESYVAADIRLAKDAIVILNHLCYSAGSSESGNPEPTIPVAKQRVDNFASGFLRAGARAVMADSATGNVVAMIRSIFTTHQTLDTAWHGQYFAHHHDIVWTPLRNPAYTADMDPDTATTGFHRSLTGNLALTTDQIAAGASAPKTNVDPTTLQAPGAASVGSTALALASDSTLSAPVGASLAAGTKVRVDQLQGSPAAAHVATLDGATSGWVAADGLIPRDSVSPQLWALDGQTTITPNFDGDADSLNLLARFSEVVTWKTTITDPGAGVLKTASGSGDSAVIPWNPVSGGVAAAPGDYGWSIHATDAWGNPALDASGVFHVVSAPTPQTGVLSFAPSTTMTNASTLTYGLTFAGPVTGLGAGDFTVTGSAAGCSVGAPTGSGTSYTVTVGGCGTGKVTLSLEPGTVSDGTQSGPAGLITAHWVVVDRTAPKATTPNASLRTAVTLSGLALQASLAWTATDSGGSGLRDYDIARSTDDGGFAVVATGLTSPSWSVSMSAGHTYRFEVRPHDRAGNTGSWVAGPTLSPALVQQTSTNVTWAGSWTTLSSTSYSGGSSRQTSGAGASATYSFSGRAIAVVLTRCATCGQVKVYVDGTLVATVDTNAASTGYRWVGWSRRFSSWGSHTVALSVVGTAGHPTVGVDAFEVLR
jgi:hypothetical protein